jgi:hypothetical protein
VPEALAPSSPSTPTELVGSVADMSDPDHYEATTRRAQDEVIEAGHRPYNIEEVALAFGVSVNTVNTDWRGQRLKKVDVVKRFPLETWPGPMWAESVLAEWAANTNRRFKPIRRRRSRSS